jgi:hypothetical protein
MILKVLLLQSAMLLLLGVSGLQAADLIKLRNGMSFNHKGHQNERVGKCYVCHDNVTVSKDEKQVTTAVPGKIAGFGKDWIHKNCRDCHDLFGEGPTKCNECHRSSSLQTAGSATAKVSP